MKKSCFLIYACLFLCFSGCGISSGPSLLDLSSNTPPLKPTDGVFTTSGDEHGCGLFAGGMVKCWGGSQYGQLGQGSTLDIGDDPGEMGSSLPAVDLGTGVKAIGIDAGRDYTCALTLEKKLKCWGRSRYGEFTVGSATFIGDGPSEMGDALPYLDLGTGRTVVKFSIGSNHACAILDNQTLKCWGRNNKGQLGQGDLNNRGLLGGEMGDNLLAVDLGTGFVPAEVYAYREHTCAKSTNGIFKCWGDNDFGQLGLEDTTDRGGLSNQMGDNLPAVNVGAGRKIEKFGLGYYHTCVLLDNATVKCWGKATDGALGYEDITHRGGNLSDMGDNLPAVAFGTGRKVRDLFVGRENNCALLDDNSLKCWGVNSDGQLGLGNVIKQGETPGSMGDGLPVVDLGSGLHALQVDMGSYQVCALINNRKFKCWGLNDYGQLGLGDKVSRGDDPLEMGDALPFLELF